MLVPPRPERCSPRALLVKRLVAFMREVDVGEAPGEPAAYRLGRIEVVKGVAQTSGKPPKPAGGQFRWRQQRKVLFGDLGGAETFFDPRCPGMNHSGKREMRAGRRIAGAELEIETRCRVVAGETPDRAEANRRLPVLRPEIVEGGAPTVRNEPPVRDDAGSKKADDGGQMLEHACEECARKLAHAMRAGRVVGHRPPVGGIPEAQMDMHAVSDAIRLDERREGDPLCAALADGPHGFPKESGLIGDRQAADGLDGNLVLIGAVLLHHRFRVDSTHSECRHQCLAECPLGPEGGERVSLATCRIPVGQVKFVLERSEDGNAGNPLQPLERSAQDGAGAALPCASVEVADIAEHHVLDRPPVTEIDLRTRSRISDQQQISKRSVGAVGDAVQTGDLNIRGRPTNLRIAAV